MSAGVVSFVYASFVTVCAGVLMRLQLATYVLGILFGIHSMDVMGVGVDIVYLYLCSSYVFSSQRWDVAIYAHTGYGYSKIKQMLGSLVVSHVMLYCSS